MTTERRLVALVVLGLTLLPGCLISSSSTTETTGKFVSDETLAQVQPGARADFVLALLGEPTSRVPLEDGQEIWKWQYREEKRSKGGVFLLVSGRSSTEKSGTVFVVLRDGIVDRTWRD